MTLSSDPIAPRDTAYGRWLTARQVHSEDRFHLVRPGLDLAPMGRGDFARYTAEARGCCARRICPLASGRASGGQTSGPASIARWRGPEFLTSKRRSASWPATLTRIGVRNTVP
jgi:hypothetical protein